MHLAFHGGKCCGIKTIYEMGENPDGYADALVALDKEDNSDVLYSTTSTSTRFFHLAAPIETRRERLDRYLAYVKERRPQHIVEITLAVGEHWDQKPWFPVLLERGFKRVNSCKNSNSGNTVHVYHLNVGE